jgi:hypothetical protein
MELKKRNYKGSYLLDYIAEGEAPDEVRNVMRQRSRWCKGHMQVSSLLSSVGFQRCRLFSPQRFRQGVKECAIEGTAFMTLQVCKAQGERCVCDASI